jgi:hypothetical protein
VHGTGDLRPRDAQRPPIRGRVRQRGEFKAMNRSADHLDIGDIAVIIIFVALMLFLISAPG